MGRNVMALIVLKQGQTATEEEIINYCKERLATYKPKSVIFVNSLPKTATERSAGVALVTKAGILPSTFDEDGCQDVVYRG